MFCVSHRFSRFTLLTPNEWVAGTQPCDRARYACQRDMLIILQFKFNVKPFLQRFGLIHEGGVYIPRMNSGVLTPNPINWAAKSEIFGINKMDLGFLPINPTYV